VYFIAKHLYGDRAALCSAAFLAIAPQAVVDSHYARPESFVIFLVALACYLALKNCQQKKRSCVLLESSIWGVAFACKFSFFPMVLLAFAVNAWKQQRLSQILLWFVGFVFGVAISAPYLVKDLSGFWYGIGLLKHQYAATDAQGGWWHFTSLWQLLAYLAVFFGIPVFLVMLAAGFQLQRAGRLFFVLSALCSVFYLLVFSVQGVFFERNLSHLLPLWGILFGAGADALLTRMKGKSALLLMKGVLCCCLAWLLFLSASIDKEMFIGLAKNKNKISNYERELLQEFSATKIVSLNVLNPASSQRLSSLTLLRVSMPKISSTGLIEVFLQKSGFAKIAAMEQPLAFLPYNQLQINQLPPAYIYYRKIGSNVEVEAP
jgi:4-amino-4-deoxy-L-arabinose transferase-like glycosyltransferase